MTEFLSILKVVLGVVALAAFVKYLVLPWIAPLYARYKEWVEKTASGQK